MPLQSLRLSVGLLQYCGSEVIATVKPARM